MVRRISDIKDIRFIANDKLMTSLAWGKSTSRWIITDNAVGLIQSSDSFTLAVHTMEILTNTIAAEWSIQDNV